jgi:tetratricopeptide (TPR) repeat protein
MADSQDALHDSVREALNEALAGRYELQRVLGQGGMGTVYLARDLKHERQVAIKTIHAHLATTQIRDRFEFEIQVTAHLQHPSVLPLLDSGVAGDTLYYIMPFVEGESLGERLKREGTLPTADVIEIGREVASALAYAHSRDVVHRDIKPDNIMLTSDRAVVADFGISKALGEDEGADLTKSGALVGTPAYMPLEQFTGEVTARGDIYALGAVLYEALTGRKWTLGTPVDQADWDGVESEVRSALSRALETEPEGRWEDAEAFRKALDEAGALHGARGVIQEVHRRRLWQVLVSYAFGAWLVYQAAEALASGVGLPLWFGNATIVVLALGLPVLVLTALAQSKRIAAGEIPGRRRGVRRLLTWRRALAGGVAAFTLLGLGTAGYMAMRSLGIGPPATLLARGILEEQAEVVLADFAAAPEDSVLARTLTEALRIDLAQSPVIRLVPAGVLRRVLRRMERDPAAGLDAEVALEAAVREGLAAVIAGEIIRTGEIYMLTAELLEAASGEPLVTVRATAEGQAEVLAAIDQLSKELRERIGESLKSIRQARPLPDVTTNSLEALEKFTEAPFMSPRGIALMEEAVALDTAFAMAWRRLAMMLSAQRREPSRSVHAVTQAFEHRDRLQEAERYIVEGSYFGVTGEHEKSIAAYQNVLALPADERRGSGPLIDENTRVARNNLAIGYMRLRRYEQAEEVLLAFLIDQLPFRCGGSYMALYETQLELGKLEEARKDSEDCIHLFQGWAEKHWWSGNIAVAETRYRKVEELQGEDLVWRARASEGLANVASVRGRLAQAEAHTRDAAAAHRAREQPGDFLVAAVLAAERELLVRGDTLGALRGIEVALGEAPLSDLHPLDGPSMELAALYAQAGQPRAARSLIAELEEAGGLQYRGVFLPSTLASGAEYHRAKGELALAEGRHADAVAEFRSADTGSCTVCALPGLARAYAVVGEQDSVVAALERYVNTPNFGRLRWVDRVHLGPTLERLAQLYDARGNVERAAECYARFVDLWADADDELQERVGAARERLAEIGLSPDGGCGFDAPTVAPGGFAGLAVADSSNCHTVRGSIDETSHVGTIDGDLEGTVFTLSGQGGMREGNHHSPEVTRLSITGGTVPELVGRDLKLWADNVSEGELLPPPGVFESDVRLLVRYPGSGDLTARRTLDATDRRSFNSTWAYSGVVCP